MAGINFTTPWLLSKADELAPLNLGPTSAWHPSGSYQLVEGSFAEVVQLIAGFKFVSFLTPGGASRNDVGHGIGLS